MRLGNVTVTGQTAGGYVTVSWNAPVPPPVSTINFPVSDNRANNLAVFLNPTGGTLNAVYWTNLNNSCDLIFDVTGYFGA